MTPREALAHIRILTAPHEALQSDAQRNVLLRSIIVVAQKGLGVAPDGIADSAANIVPFPDPKR
jgi:hypothetical protein